MSANVMSNVKSILQTVVGDEVDVDDFSRDTLLLGSVPQFDSIAVVSTLVEIEDYFDIEVNDDEIDASMFESVGTLCDFIEVRLAA